MGAHGAACTPRKFPLDIRPYIVWVSLRPVVGNAAFGINALHPAHGGPGCRQPWFEVAVCVRIVGSGI